MLKFKDFFMLSLDGVQSNVNLLGMAEKFSLTKKGRVLFWERFFSECFFFCGIDETESQFV